MTWEPYFNGRIIKKCDGYFIIKPANSDKEIVPLSCPVCTYLLRTSDDEKSYKNFGCCENCETLWARPNQEVWRAGWRPDLETVQKKIGRKKLKVSIQF
jgi:hypothetical protein